MFSQLEEIHSKNTWVHFPEVLWASLLSCFGCLWGKNYLGESFKIYHSDIQLHLKKKKRKKFFAHINRLSRYENPYAIIISPFACASLLEIFGMHSVGIDQDLLGFRKWSPQRPPRVCRAMTVEVMPLLTGVRFQWQKVTVATEERKYRMCKRLK